MTHGQDLPVTIGREETGDFEFLLGQRPGPDQVFHGTGDRGETLKMLARLSGQMANAWLERYGLGRNGPGFDNPNIPAGYTYLGQLIAHDVSFSPSALHRGPTNIGSVRNLHTSCLDLDCLYGGGPQRSPDLYQIQDGDLSKPRSRFRIGKTGSGPIEDLGVEDKDLPRRSILSSCLTSTDAIDSVPDPRRAHETLIADPRNEDNLILSQLIVLLMRFHNKVVDQLQSRRGGASAHSIAFEKAREITERTYRDIVLKDYLRALLHPKIWSHYNAIPSTDRLPFFNPDLPCRIPVEFTVGAFRVGHAMIQNDYNYNEFHEVGPNGDGKPASIEQLMRFRPDADSSIVETLPINNDWIIDWDRFFPRMQVDPTERYRPVTSDGAMASQLLAPLMNEVLTNHRGFRPKSEHGLDPQVAPMAGLFYRDFARAYDLGLPTGQALAEAFSVTALEREVLVDAMRAGLPSLTDDDVAQISKHTPLLYYLLVEANVNEHGWRLGELGSRITAEVMFGLLRLAKESRPHAVSDADLNALFGTSSVPSSMRAVVKFVSG